MGYVLAIDGGGSKTQVVCADETGQVVGEGFSGPTSLEVTNPGAASFNLREAIRQAIEKLPPAATITKAVMGLAGLDSPAEEVLARQAFSPCLDAFPGISFILVNDIVIALEGGTSKSDAIALISGTGSNCYGRNQQGQTAKSGGMGWLLTDQGSGYAIGRATLRMAVKSYDGRIKKSQIEQLVCEHFRISSIADLENKIYSPQLSKTEVAELAQVCLRSFDQGDEVAKGIFDHSVNELGIMAETVIRKINLDDKPFDCVLAGSITKIAYVQSQLTERLAKSFPQMQVIVPTTAPVHGALNLALKLWFFTHNTGLILVSLLSTQDRHGARFEVQLRT